MSGYNKERPRTIRLFCPSVSKLVRFVACDSHKLDVGSISRLFGLDPSTVKLNGHFISRGVDLVSSSVTWRSLLSFFSSKGLSTGTDGDHKRALIVDGKLCKVGIKRAHEPQDDVNLSGDSAGNPGINDAGITAKRHLKDICSVENKRLRESRSAGSHDGGECSNGIGFKRKSSMENHSLLKKLKINETNSELKGKGNNKVSPVYSTPFKCSYLSGNMKRGREDEMIAGVPSKRISSG
ncbi:GPI transamidase component Gpi16 subunit family protein isoform 1 [Hibiscus syriacus]|uniref:GPI transamidase component Gpi16 subunit family protein isoform 1 n=1 Tax=Hibiscus syriacus TaxID=106335 RepID=A0A6A2ZLX7_HIBSY|nr:uncharacterized protein LOC120143514 isoform X1 [Hibiscus syriacus]KAE8692142.1 GPI transamidase component Gpi16 subunit family protein isoform 1 [Hibiscus syriacus]